jgi:endonuclease/exonuclease/phosphatase family metal-dependent hydrolase
MRSSFIGSAVLTCGLLGLVASPWGSEAAASAEEEAAAKATSLRVMTFNIRYGTADDKENRWERRKDLVFDVIRRHAPDVVGLQEALKFQIDEIRGAVSGYEKVGVGRDDGKDKGEWSAILYRKERLRVTDSGTFWFSDTPETPGSTSWGNEIPRICTWGRFVDATTGSAFYVYNVHLDHRSQPSREKSTELLVKRIAERSHPDPVIVTGDFNAGEDNPAIVSLKKNGKLVDTYRAVHPDAKDVGTFNAFAGRKSGAKIDYIFAPKEVGVEESSIVDDNEDGRYPSDHFPIKATLRTSGQNRD